MEGAQFVGTCHLWTPNAAPVVSSWWKEMGFQEILETVATMSWQKKCWYCQVLLSSILMTKHTAGVWVCVCDCTKVAL